MVEELDGVLIVAVAVDGAVFDIEPVVLVCFSVNESTVFELSLKPLLPLGTAVIGAPAVAKLPGHSSTYVVSAILSSSEALWLLVGNSSETPPCSSETTRIVTVTTLRFVVLVFLLTEAEEGGGEAKMSAVPAAVMPCTVEVEADALVELT